MKKNKYFMDLAHEYGPIQLEDCFKNMTIDPILIKEIERLGVFSKNQKYYIHYVINGIIDYAKKGFVDGINKIDALFVSWPVTWGNSPENKLIRHIGKYEDIIYTEFLKDYEDIFPKKTIIGSINSDPFPAVEESYIYRELLDPDNYDAPYYVLDFVNKKLNEALPGHNLWARALDLDSLSIYDLDILPHMKTY